MFERGQIKEVGGRLLGVCADCGRLIRWDKPFLGSLHLCLSAEQRALKQEAEQMYAQQRRNASMPSLLAGILPKKGDHHD